jgi:GIY-YIG catalytic domain
MTSGIYLLKFSKGSVYVGQAVNISQRWKQHNDKFLKGQAANKMQYAFNTQGMPEGSILIECHKDYLDILETFYINLFKDANFDMLNTVIPKLNPAINYDLLVAFKDLLQNSSTGIINALIETTHQVKELTKEVEELKEPIDWREQEITIRERERFNTEWSENKAVEAMKALEKANKALETLKSRTFIQRLFNL